MSSETRVVPPREPPPGVSVPPEVTSAAAHRFGLPTATALVIGTGVFALPLRAGGLRTDQPGGVRAGNDRRDGAGLDVGDPVQAGARLRRPVRVRAGQLHNAGVTRRVVALITQTVLDATDPAFSTPTKFIGPVYNQHEATRLAARHGWPVAADGPAWRRVVASPQPQRILEQPSIAQLLDAGAVVVCGGGGGVPGVEDAAGRLTGVEAVIDKDLTAARLPLAWPRTGCCYSPMCPP